MGTKLVDHIIIFSAYKKELSKDENKARHHGIISGMRLLNLRFTECLGNYMGDLEESILVIIENDSQREYIRKLAIFLEQESILERFNDGMAFLYYLDNSEPRLKLGKINEISQAEAFSSMNYTYVKSTGRYYQAG